MSSNLRIYSYSTCTTCKKALKWLSENQIEYQLIDIVQDPPPKEIFVEAIKQLGSRKKLFNTSGLSYRSLGSSVVKSMNDEEVINALVSDAKLIKRPFVSLPNDSYLIGFKEDKWAEELILNNKINYLNQNG